MKKICGLIFIFLMMLSGHLAYAADIDPILIDKPSPIVYECSRNMYIEIPRYGTIYYTIDDIDAEVYFLLLKAEVLYLEEGIWDGIDKSSFILKHKNAEGQEDLFQLNYMMTARESLVNEWPTISEPLFFGWLLPINLIFDIPTGDNKGWSLIFRPAERGGDPVCEIEIPLKVWEMEDSL